MGSLSGTIRNIVGGDLPTYARVSLVPADEAVDEGGEVRIGAVLLTLDSEGGFTVSDVPDGTYRLSIRTWDPASRHPLAFETVTFDVVGATALGSALGLGLLVGPYVLAFAVDTDGAYYYAPGTGTHSVFLDTDGQPYLAVAPGGSAVYTDLDDNPVIPAAS